MFLPDIVSGLATVFHLANVTVFFSYGRVVKSMSEPAV